MISIPQTALVTGASGGIGRAAALALAKEGYTVAIHYKSNKKAAEETLSMCNRFSKENCIVQADLSSEDEVTTMFKNLSNSFSRIGVLVNNAGIFDKTDNPTNITAFENVYRNNFLSVVLTTKHVLPRMKQGKIVNISSIHARLGHGRPGAIAYSAFKAALENYTKNLAKDLAPNILVNAVAPGRVRTQMWGNLAEEEAKELGTAHLIQRMIEPEEVADAMLFLIKNDAICGEVLTIDGGMSLMTLG